MLKSPIYAVFGVQNPEYEQILTIARCWIDSIDNIFTKSLH